MGQWVQLLWVPKYSFWPRRVTYDYVEQCVGSAILLVSRLGNDGLGSFTRRTNITILFLMRYGVAYSDVLLPRSNDGMSAPDRDS